LLCIFKDSLTLVMIDLLVTSLIVLFEWYYMVFVLGVRAKLTHWDGKLFKESFIYTILMFLTSVVAQVNNNFSNVIIGAKVNSVAVTVYSMAALIFGMYEQLSTAISGVMLPTVTNSLKNDDEKFTNTINLVKSTGRIQFLLLGAVFAGFAILGKQFIAIWLGDGYEQVYYLVMILLGPALLELCINVCLSILRAKNMLGFRTGVITASMVLNLIIVFVGLNYVGIYAAALGTAISIFVGSIVVMGIYYYRKLKLNILTLYRGIFKGIWISILISAIVCYFTTYLVDGAMAEFIVGFVSFVVVYVLTLMLFGLNKEEKNIIYKTLNKKGEMKNG